MNQSVVADGVVAAERERPAVRVRSSRTVNGVAILLVTTIVLQRFAIPVGSLAVPLILPLGLGAAAAMMCAGWLRLSPTRMLHYSAAGAVLASASYFATWHSPVVRATSLLMVLSVFALWVLVAPGAAKLGGGRKLLDLYAWLMVAAATVAIVQMAAQLAGVWVYRDPIGELVPPQYLLPDYNTSIPVEYGSPIYKSQAFIFLEPSIFSQFVALGMIAAAWLRRPVWQLVVMGLGLVCALSGTGLMLLAAGILALLAYRTTPRLSYVVVGTIAVIAVALSPAGDILRDRTDEVNHSSSSLALRFVIPYQEVAKGLQEDPVRWVVGAGPGSSDRLLESARESAGLAVVYTAPAKLLFEYGLPAMLVFLAFLLSALFRGTIARPLAWTLLFQMLFLGGFLGAPHAIFTAWCLIVAWGQRE